MAEYKNTEHKNETKQAIKMLSGYDLPTFAYGTSWRYGINAYWGGHQHKIWKNEMSSAHKTEEEKLEECIASAIKNGYRCIDSAQGY